jgi:DNA-binding NarL/FixJ family response regulator
MADKRRILIVDDDFEIALFLRTTLEIMWPDYDVVNVPSAEEGMLESRQGIDLVITDLNLPGMSGFNFISWLRRTAPETPIILITGERSPKLREEAMSLGLAGFFLKPIHVEELANLVRQTLAVEMPPAEAATTRRLIPAGVARRLSALRIDTGAHYAMLVDVGGNCLAADGHVQELNRDRIAALLATGLTNSFELAQALRAPQPFTISYQAGAFHDLYAANVGANHIIALVFDSQRGQKKIGAVWVFARQAVRDLLEMLTDLEIAPAAVTQPEPEPTTPEPTAEPTPPEPAPKEAQEISPEPEITAEPAPAPAPGAEPVAPTPAELTPAEPTPAEPAVIVPDEVNAFWERVFSEDVPGEDDAFEGLSLEEAQARGLMPSDLDLPS